MDKYLAASRLYMTWTDEAIDKLWNNWCGLFALYCPSTGQYSRFIVGL